MQELRMVKVGNVREHAVRFTHPEIIYAECQYMTKLDREHFVVLHMNRQRQVIAKETVSIGSLTQTVVHPREVFKAAVHNGSDAIICVHNHPSGDPSPSPEDIAVTHRLRDAGDLIGISVVDHIIIGHEQFVSLAARGFMYRAPSHILPPKSEPTKEEQQFRKVTGQYLKELRKQTKLTQANLYKATGIYQCIISAIERGRRDITEPEARKLAAVFRIDYRKFLFISPEENNKEPD